MMLLIFINTSVPSAQRMVASDLTPEDVAASSLSADIFFTSLICPDSISSPNLIIDMAVIFKAKAIAICLKILYY